MVATEAIYLLRDSAQHTRLYVVTVVNLLGGTGFNCADYLRLALLPRGCWQRPSFRRVPARNSPPAPVCLCQLAGPVA